MTDKPIIFSAPMVRALLDGRKTQTRRVVKIKDHLDGYTFTGDLVDYYGNGRLGMVIEGSTLVQPIPYAPGDRLWVREGYAFGWPIKGNQSFPECNQAHAITYRADGNQPFGGSKWQSPIHMPRWASRLTLTVTDVRVQRVQGISEADARAEGACDPEWLTAGNDLHRARRSFECLWNSLHGPDAWDANPWVVALTFDVHRCNIDRVQG